MPRCRLWKTFPHRLLSPRLHQLRLRRRQSLRHPHLLRLQSPQHLHLLRLQSPQHLHLRRLQSLRHPRQLRPLSQPLPRLRLRRKSKGNLVVS